MIVILVPHASPMCVSLKKVQLLQHKQKTSNNCELYVFCLIPIKFGISADIFPKGAYFYVNKVTTNISR